MKELNETEKEILAALAHLPNNYALGQFIRRKYQPLLDEIRENGKDPKKFMDVEKKFRGPAQWI